VSWKVRRTSEFLVKQDQEACKWELCTKSCGSALMVDLYKWSEFEAGPHRIAAPVTARAKRRIKRSYTAARSILLSSHLRPAKPLVFVHAERAIGGLDCETTIGFADQKCCRGKYRCTRLIYYRRPEWNAIWGEQDGSVPRNICRNQTISGEISQYLEIESRKALTMGKIRTR
jgi:hypothetical protein